MKGKKVHVRLTNSELAMMQLLWEAGRPLNRAEIMDIELRALAQVFGVRYASLLSTPAVYRRGGRP